MPSSRYAELLKIEIPPGQKLEVFLSLYREKKTWNPRNMFLFLGHLFTDINENEFRQIYAIISEDFKYNNDSKLLGNILQSLPPEIWAHVEEVAALRIENKMINSLNLGTYGDNGKVSPDTLGIAAARYYPFFRLKKELVSVISVCPEGC